MGLTALYGRWGTQALNPFVISAIYEPIADGLPRSPHFRRIVLATRLFLAGTGERERWWPSNLWDSAGDIALKPLFPETWSRQRLVLGNLVARTAEARELKRSLGDKRRSLFFLDPAFDAAVDHDLRIIAMDAARRVDSALGVCKEPVANGIDAFSSLATSSHSEEFDQIERAFVELCRLYSGVSPSRWSPPTLEG
jgi:hypothetical protein